MLRVIVDFLKKCKTASSGLFCPFWSGYEGSSYHCCRSSNQIEQDLSHPIGMMCKLSILEITRMKS